MVTREESGRRIARLQQELQVKGIDGALIIHPIDIYYFAGTRQNSVLWVPAAGEPLLLVRKSFSRAQDEAAVADIRPFPSSKEFPALFGEDIRRVGLTFDVVPVQQYNFYAKLLTGREFVDISGINREIRSVKSAWELEQMHYSAAQLCNVLAQVPTFLKPGMRELDLAAEFECRLRKAGDEGYIRMRAFNQELFHGLAVSGANAEQPGFFDGPITGRGLSSAAPHGASREPIAPNVPIIMDYVGKFNGYHTDVTRVFVFGKLRPELQRAFDVALSIQDFLEQHLRPGAISEELFAGAFAIAEKAGLGANFMGAAGEQAKFVGHGIGLELDEFPVIAQGFKVPLLLNQTMAIEPKFVLPGMGVVGIENDFIVGEDGGVRITNLADAVVHL